MADLKARRDELAAGLTSTTDHRELAEASAALADVDMHVAEAEERWLALAEEAEGLGLHTEG